MSTTTAAELSLINDTEFLEDPAHVGPADPFGSLDAGLPVHATAPPFGAPLLDREPVGYDDYDGAAQIARARNEDIPFVAAALVIAACLTAGAATAGFVLHDRLVQITAASASR
jgi:hypothetical protein